VYNPESRVRTTVVDHHDIDVAGVTAVLGRFSDRVSLVPPDADDVDVVLYGVRQRHAGHDPALHTLLRRSSATVIVLDWAAEPPSLDWALACGAHGRLSKTMPGSELVAGLERIDLTRDRGRQLPRNAPCHPALLAAQLTPREREVLSLITRGLTNQEIADLAYLSINSVKTYVRSAYRKIGVTRRSQAVRWGLTTGLDHAPEPVPTG
jgi:two-component system, NarL family, response regulator LiaR